MVRCNYWRKCKSKKTCPHAKLHKWTNNCDADQYTPCGHNEACVDVDTRHKHSWVEIGQTYVDESRTLVYWCVNCGTLKFTKVAGSYSTWFKHPKIKENK